MNLHVVRDLMEHDEMTAGLDDTYSKGTCRPLTARSGAAEGGEEP